MASFNANNGSRRERTEEGNKRRAQSTDGRPRKPNMLVVAIAAKLLGYRVAPRYGVARRARLLPRALYSMSERSAETQTSFLEMCRRVCAWASVAAKP